MMLKSLVLIFTICVVATTALSINNLKLIKSKYAKHASSYTGYNNWYRPVKDRNNDYKSRYSHKTLRHHSQQQRYPPASFYKREILHHRRQADEIIQHITQGKGKGQIYKRLADFVDKFGSRLCGTENLEKSIDWLVETLRDEGLENVHKEPVQVPRWLRKKEKATLLEPREKEVGVLALGTSVSTPEDGLTADVVVVRSFGELTARSSEVKGKIVVYNQPFDGYSKSVQYRTKGASEAAKYGAVAALVRSVTGYSLYTLHTGSQSYQAGVVKIPVASITVEDAELLQRMSDRGEKIRIWLNIQTVTLPETTSYNLVAEVKGAQHPEQVVIIGGHIDSWDVGQGAVDDGGGAFISWQVLSTMLQLGFRPRRTIRLVMFTCEETGLIGAEEYIRRHSPNAANIDLVMESDEGTFKTFGLTVTADPVTLDILTYLANRLLPSINATMVKEGASLSDMSGFTKYGIPGASLFIDEADNYFNYHHTKADTMTPITSSGLDQCAAVWTVTSFVVADMTYLLPANRSPSKTGRRHDIKFRVV